MTIAPRAPTKTAAEPELGFKENESSRASYVMDWFVANLAFEYLPFNFRVQQIHHGDRLRDRLQLRVGGFERGSPFCHSLLQDVAELPPGAASISARKATALIFHEVSRAIEA
jgi:hypothetical protein